MNRYTYAGLFAAVVLFALPGQALSNSDVQQQALAVFKIVQKQDWKGLYRVAAFSPKVAKSLPTDPAVFAAQVKQGIQGSGNKAKVDEVFAGMSDLAVGKPQVMGKKADVPTSCKIKMNDKTITFKGVIHMIKQGAAWKWDMTGSDDPGTATSEAFQSLIGKPVGPTGAPKGKTAQ